MPDSKQMSIEQRLKNEVSKATSALQLYQTIAAALPDRCGKPSQFAPFGYCADASLTFADPQRLSALLEAYPPLPVIWLRGFDGHTFKPLAALRDYEQEQDYLSVYPVVRRVSGVGAPNASWWTLLDGKRIEIDVRGEAREYILESMQTARDYVGVVEHGKEAYLPRLKAPATRLGAAAQWRASSDDERSSISEESVLTRERAEVHEICRYLEEHIFVHGYIQDYERESPRYVEYIRHAVESHVGIRCGIAFMSHTRAGRSHFEMRLVLDPAHRDESFYDVKIAQNASQRLKLRDIPVSYVI